MTNRAHAVRAASGSWGSTWPMIGITALFVAALFGATLLSPYAPLLMAGATVVGIVVALALSRIEYAIVALVGAASLDQMGRVAEFGGVKITLYQGLALAVFAYMAWQLATRRTTWRRTPIDLPLATFVALIIASIPVAGQPVAAVVQFASFVSSAGLVYAVALLAADKGRLQAVTLGTLGVSAAVGVLAMLERLKLFALQPYLEIWNQGVRARATFDDPNIMGAFETGALLLALPLVLTSKSWSTRLLGGLGLLATAAGVVASGSRGSLVALALGLFIVLGVSKVKTSTKIAALVIAIVLATAFLALLADPVWLEKRVLGVAQDPSWLSRLTMAESALRMSADNPMGIGFGNYPFVYPYYREAVVRATLVESHTAYLTVLVETGILGLIAFVWILGAWATSMFGFLRSKVDGILHAIGAGAAGAFTALSAQALTYSLETSKLWWLTMGIGIAAMIAWKNNALDGGTGSDE